MIINRYESDLTSSYSDIHMVQNGLDRQTYMQSRNNIPQTLVGVIYEHFQIENNLMIYVTRVHSDQPAVRLC